jgi:hypothetical protein
MKLFYKALCAAALVTPLLITSADAAVGGLLGRGRSSNNGSGSQSSGQPSNVGPQGGGSAVGGGGGFRGDGGFRGGGGFRGRDRDRFSGSIFIGPGFGPGWYDPFWWPYGPYGYGYGYGYSYYPPPRYVERAYGPPPEDYLIPPGGPPPEQNWYHCRNPEGFYPYVRECNERWEAVPAAPPPDGPPPPRQGG